MRDFTGYSVRQGIRDVLENDSCLWTMHEGISKDLVSYEALEIKKRMFVEIA